MCVFGCASLATYNCIVVTNQKPIQFIACRRHINDIICDQYSQMIPLNHQSFPYFISTLIQTIHYGLWALASISFRQSFETFIRIVSSYVITLKVSICDLSSLYFVTLYEHGQFVSVLMLSKVSVLR